MKKLRTIQGDLALEVYYRPNAPSVSNAIFLGGFPVFPSSNILIEQLVAAGMAVYFPQYYGSFDSNGIFTFNSLVETAVETARLIKRGLTGSVSSDFSPCQDQAVKLLVGHSFGGIAASYAAPKIVGLEQLLISSSGLRYSTQTADTGLNENFALHLENVRQLWRNTYRIGTYDDWKFIIEGDLPARNAHSALVQDTFVLIGGSDQYFDAEKVTNSNRQVLQLILGPQTRILTKVVSGAGHSPNSIYGAFDLSELGLKGI